MSDLAVNSCLDWIKEDLSKQLALVDRWNATARGFRCGLDRLVHPLGLDGCHRIQLANSTDSVELAWDDQDLLDSSAA